jgi:hypothetical protein
MSPLLGMPVAIVTASMIVTVAAYIERGSESADMAGGTCVEGAKVERNFVTFRHRWRKNKFILFLTREWSDPTCRNLP